MITFTKAYVAGDKTYATLREAQIAAIEEILTKTVDTDIGKAMMKPAAEAIVDAADQVVCALTTTERSKPKARALNGGRKPRKPKSSDATPQFKLAATAPE